MINEELEYITDSRLEELVSSLLLKYHSAIEANEEEMYRNVIDPFSSLFDSMEQGISLKEWLRLEKSRQTQKTLQNMVGEFHQHVIGSIKGWEDLGVGGAIDLRNMEKKIIAEVKNKHNTMNSGSSLTVYDNLHKHLDYGESYKGFTAYCVMIIPKNPSPMDTYFCPSQRAVKRPQRESIKKIDGKSFYTIATGDPMALEKLYNRLPLIIGRIKGIDPVGVLSSSEFANLFKRAYIKKGKD